jgi:hypothetical protein
MVNRWFAFSLNSYRLLTEHQMLTIVEKAARSRLCRNWSRSPINCARPSALQT